MTNGERTWRSLRLIRDQLCKNAIALISLLVALSSVSYSAWRNERTERNRNIRVATFEILTKLADFERVVYLAHYDRDRTNGNPRIGWTDVIVIYDLTTVAPPPLEAKAAALRTAWRENWEHLDESDEEPVNRIEAAVDALRAAAIANLRSLQ